MLEALVSKYGVEFPSGHLIFCENEPGNDFYLIQKGRVKITKLVKDKETTLAILESGDIFGEMAILEEAPRSATAIALDKVLMLHFDRQNFVPLMTSQPQIAYRLLTIFTKRLYELRRRVMILKLDNIQARVADTFLMLAEKEFGSTFNGRIVLNIRTDEVAGWCSEPVDSVQQVITGFMKNGKLEQNLDQIVLNNIGDMVRLVGVYRKK
jgi:CRP/FNR family transcriptional regulator, cyclic AMP receptor protein